MRKLQFVTLALMLCSQLVLAQQAATYRVGDIFKGPVKAVRTERTHFVREGDRAIESSPTLMKLTTYTLEGLSRESISYGTDGSVLERRIERWRSDGKQIDISIFEAKDKLSLRIAYEYNDFGLPVSETRYNPDGSVKEVRLVESDPGPNKIMGHTKVARNGSELERAVNTRDETNKTSRWTSTLADGSRTENIHSLDPTKDHFTETLSYGPDGSLKSRRISKSDRAVTRLEATEFDGKGNLLKKTLETREYDARRNLIKLVNFRWNAELQQFEPAAATYHRITYFE